MHPYYVEDDVGEWDGIGTMYYLEELVRVVGVEGDTAWCQDVEGTVLQCPPRRIA